MISRCCLVLLSLVFIGQSALAAASAPRLSYVARGLMSASSLRSARPILSPKHFSPIAKRQMARIAIRRQFSTQSLAEHKKSLIEDKTLVFEEALEKASMFSTAFFIPRSPDYYRKFLDSRSDFISLATRIKGEPDQESYEPVLTRCLAKIRELDGRRPVNPIVAGKDKTFGDLTSPHTLPELHQPELIQQTLESSHYVLEVDTQNLKLAELTKAFHDLMATSVFGIYLSPFIKNGDSDKLIVKIFNPWGKVPEAGIRDLEALYDLKIRLLPATTVSDYAAFDLNFKEWLTTDLEAHFEKMQEEGNFYRRTVRLEGMNKHQFLEELASSYTHDMHLTHFQRIGEKAVKLTVRAPATHEKNAELNGKWVKVKNPPPAPPPSVVKEVHKETSVVKKSDPFDTMLAAGIGAAIGASF